MTPPPALAAAPAVAEHVPAPAQLTEPGPATTYAQQLTVQQLLHSPQEVNTSLKKEVGLFIIRQFLSHTGGSRIFFRRGCTRLLLYFNNNKPHSFFLQNTSCIRKPQVISGGGGGAHPLHPPPRSAPVTVSGWDNHSPKNRWPGTDILRIE